MSDAFFAALRTLNDKAATVDRDVRKDERASIVAQLTKFRDDMTELPDCNEAYISGMNNAIAMIRLRD